MKKVTVIIPVYNASKFLDQCINSVLKQDYDNMEILLLNDGSTDNSIDILRKYEQKHPNKIRVYSHENMGVGRTRNKGIQLSEGHYITFLDADDYIASDYISTLVKNLKNGEMIISGYKRMDQNDTLVCQKKPVENLEWSLFKYTSTSGKLYIRKFLVDNNIVFNKCKIGEDIYFSLLAYSFAENIKIISYAGYHIVSNNESVTKAMSEKNDMLRLVKEIRNNLDLGKFADSNLLFFYLKTIVQYLIMHKNVFMQQEFYQEYKKCFQWLRKIYQEKNKRISFQYQKGEELNVNICVNLFVFVYKFHLSKPFLYLLSKINLKMA